MAENYKMYSVLYPVCRKKGLVKMNPFNIRDMTMASLEKRGKNYYVQYYVGGRPKRVRLDTDSLQISKEKVLPIEYSNPLPTKTPLADILDR
jgi:hypothetical protein